MSDLHQLQVTASEQSAIEGVDQKFLAAGLLVAREKTIAVVNAICAALKEGMSENEARLLALEIFRDFGVTKHWHQPYIRFGEGSVLSFHEPLSDHRLKPNDIYHLDVGPVWPSEILDIGAGLEYEGDYGDTYIFGQNAEAQKIIDTVHEVFHIARNEWKEKKVSGQDIYQICKAQTEARGYIFIDKVEGHRIGDFPHHKYTRTRLSKIEFVPSDSLWILEAMICDTKMKLGAFYEDLMT